MINSAPYGGRIDASPRTGIAALDAFLLESLEWTDDADDLPLFYSFSYMYGHVSTIRMLGCGPFGARINLLCSHYREPT